MALREAFEEEQLVAAEPSANGTNIVPSVSVSSDDLPAAGNKDDAPASEITMGLRSDFKGPVSNHMPDYRQKGGVPNLGKFFAQPDALLLADQGGVPNENTPNYELYLNLQSSTNG